ncbi:MAG: hypothetical protein ABI721_02985 [Candidatus Dojkabacteria bacterium]
MNWKNFKFTIAIILLIVLTALALPQFKFSIGQTEISYPNVDFSLIESGSHTGNFLRGRGLFPTKEVSSTLNFTNSELSDADKRNTLDNYLKVIRNRVLAAGLAGVEVRSEIVEGTYNLIINYPDYYSNPLKYTQWLTGKGVISFATFDQTGQTGFIDLTDKDIRGNISINFISQLGSHLQFQFDSSKASVLTSTLGTATAQSQVGFFLMDIDQSEQFFVRQYETNDATSYTVRAIPVTYSADESVDKNIMLSIFRTYFLDSKPLEDLFTTEQSVQIVPSTFTQDTTQFIAVMSLVSLVLLIILSFIKFKFEAGVKFILMIGSFVTLTIVILKYSNAVLSIGTLIGFLLTTGVATLMVWRIISENDEDNNELRFQRFLNFSIALVVLTIFLSSVVKGLSMLYDLAGVILVSGLSLAIMNFFAFKAINYLKIYLPKRFNK